MDQSSVNTPSIIISYQDFSGPLSVLLSLVEKNKLSIHEVSLSLIANEYLEKVEHYSNSGEYKEFLVDFLTIASTLVLIKSRSLVPHVPLDQEEQEEIKDLETRLQWLAMVRNASIDIEAMHNTPFVILNKKLQRVRQEGFFPDKTVTLQALHTTLSDIMRHPYLESERQDMVKIKIRPIVDLQTMMQRLDTRLKEFHSISFHELIGDSYPDAHWKEAKTHTIVGLLAVLELAHKGVCSLSQEGDLITIDRIDESS